MEARFPPKRQQLRQSLFTFTVVSLQEKVRQEDNTDALMLVESVIKLDYNTMEYKTFQRYHRLEQAATGTGASGDDGLTNNNNNSTSNNKNAIIMTKGATTIKLQPVGMKATTKNVL